MDNSYSSFLVTLSSKKRFSFFILLCFFCILPNNLLWGQSSNTGITVDDENYDSKDLAEILMNEGCPQIENSTYSSSQATAYFDGNDSDFPFEEGIIIRTGEAKLSEGKYTGEGMSSELNTDSDPFLEELSQAAGQNTEIEEIAYLEFDFVPLSEDFNFNFLFASNEYGEWQCASSDVFAFMVTDLETDETENLAVIPNTDTPVMVKNIRDNIYNSGCNSQNPEYFDTYTVENAESSSVNMRGYTQVMNASTTVTPGKTYRVRLVIGDSNDTDYDSAIFLEAGSFDISIDLGVSRDICSGDQEEIGTGLSTTIYDHAWFKDDELIPGENDNTLVIDEPGTYNVEVTKVDSECSFEASITFDELAIDPPSNLSVCDMGTNQFSYDLTQNDAENLGISNPNYKVIYYASSIDMQNNTPIPEEETTAYLSEPGHTIYIKIYNTESDHYCDTEYSFSLETGDAASTVDPDPIGVCYNPSGYSIDLTQVIEEVMQNEDQSAYTYSYHPTEDDADFAQNEIDDSSSFSIEADFGNMVVWLRIENKNEENCYIIVPINIEEYPLPEIDNFDDIVTVCTEYEIPEIDGADFYTEPGGNGDQLAPGDIIDSDGTYYIYTETDENGCANELSFELFIVEDYDISGGYCDEYEVPSPPVGEFYSETEGQGEHFPEGTLLTESQTLYYYAEIDGEACNSIPMEITIGYQTIDDDALEDVIVCSEYTLPSLEIGNYYTSSGGEGTPLEAGDVISEDQEIYVFDDSTGCRSEGSFHVYFVPNFEDISECGSYELPSLGFGGYYTAPNGNGEEFPEGTEITSSQEIYFYTETTTSPNCTQDLSFYVEIKELPPVDEYEDVKICDGDTYTLPDTDNGEYFTEEYREGDQLQEGDVITSDQRIYINSDNGECQNETSFKVKFYTPPPISNFTDIYACDYYTIPESTQGEIYTEPNGNGELIEPGDDITESQTLYIYAQLEEEPFCKDEEEFEIFITHADVGDFDDVYACDDYELPPLDRGSYYSEPHGEGSEMPSGTIIDSTQTIYIYNEEGDRFVCESETEFDVIISKTLELPEFEDVTRCGEYTLPNLEENESFEGYNVGYYRESGGENPYENSTPTININEPGEHRVYVYATSEENENCYGETYFTVKINPLHNISIENTVICTDPETGESLTTAQLDTEITDTIFTVEWYNENDNLVHTGPNFETDEPGQYTIITTKEIPDDGTNCGYHPKTIIVRESSKPIARAKVITPDFSDQPAIQVDIVKGAGHFGYSLNGSPYQEDNIFYNVESGIHTVRVKDVLNSCGVTELKVQVIQFPKYFTPNNDGFNDTWNIPDLANHPEAVIYIFDRYGKLLSTIKPSEQGGWDGNFHEKPMPSNDYWFKVKYHKEGEDRVFKSHFTLKR